MGWWTQDHNGRSFARVPVGQPEMWWGDGPADCIDAALQAVVDDFRRDRGRPPSLAELRAGILFSLNGSTYNDLIKERTDD